MQITATLLSWITSTVPTCEVVEVDHDPEEDFQVLQWQLLSLFPQSDVAADSLILIDCFGREVHEHGDLVEQDGKVSLWCVVIGQDGTLPFCSSNIADQHLIQPITSPHELELTLCEHCSTLLTSDVSSSPAAGTASYDLAVALQPRTCQRDGMITIGLAPDSMLLEKLAWTDGPQTLFATQQPVALYFENVLLARALARQRTLLASNPLPQFHQAQDKFRQRLQGAMNTVNTYEDPYQREVALSHIDFPTLLEYYLEESNKDELRSDAGGRRWPSELVLVALLRWFKDGFFQWFNQPSCPNAAQDASVPHQMVHTRIDSATAEEQPGWPSRVEVYTCQACQHVSRFPRFNNPAYMIQHSRRGRCGEFANVFGLFCRSLGFDTRYVLDFTDHVWVEVYLPSADGPARDKVVHLDPCEKALDRPLMYELGWKKSLTHVLAFSPYGVWDVIRRYSQDVPAVLSRRDGSVLPESLACAVVERADRQAWQAFLAHDASRPAGPATASDGVLDWVHALSHGPGFFQTLDAVPPWMAAAEASRRRRVTARHVARLPSPPLAELAGRTSGDEAWRRQRGEWRAASPAVLEEGEGDGLPPGSEVCAPLGHVGHVVVDVVLGGDEAWPDPDPGPGPAGASPRPLDVVRLAVQAVSWAVPRHQSVHVAFVDVLGCLWTCSGDDAWDFPSLFLPPPSCPSTADGHGDPADVAACRSGLARSKAGVVVVLYQPARGPFASAPEAAARLAARLQRLGMVVDDAGQDVDGPVVGVMAWAAGRGTGRATDRVVVDVARHCRDVHATGYVARPVLLRVDVGLHLDDVPERAGDDVEDGGEGTDGDCAAGNHILPLSSHANSTTSLLETRLSEPPAGASLAFVAAQVRLYFPLGGGLHADSRHFDSSTSVVEGLPPHPHPWTELAVYAGDALVNGVQSSAPWTSSAAFVGGQDSPRRHVLRLGEGDRIVHIAARCGALVDRLEVSTAAGRGLAAGGGGGQARGLGWTAALDLAGLFGALGGHLHRVGVVLAVPSLGFDLRRPRPPDVLDRRMYGPQPPTGPDAFAPGDAACLAHCALMTHAETPARGRGRDVWGQNALALLARRLDEVRRENPRDAAHSCLLTIATYFRNIAEHPTEGKYQRIALHNAVLQSRVLAVRGGLPLLCFGPAGFSFSNDKKALVSRFSSYEFIPVALRSSWLRLLAKLLEDYLALYD